MAKALEPLFLINNNLTEFAKEDFCTAVLEKLINGSPAGGAIGILPCLEELKPTPGAAETYRDLCDPKKFSNFHDLENGIMGTYQKLLRSLNTEVTTPALIGTGIFDPTAVAPLFGLEPPKLDELPKIEDIIAAFLPPMGVKMLELLGLDLQDLPEFPALCGELATKIPVPPKLPIPEIPSPELFELGFDFVPPGIPDLIDTGLVNFQLRSFTTPIKALIDLLPKIPDIAIGGFLPSAFGDALCGPIKSGFPIKAERPIQAAAHIVMIERSVTAVATAAVAQQLGAGGTVCKTVFETTGGPTQDVLKERLEKLRADDDIFKRNDIPKNRAAGIPSNLKGLGEGLKSETYLKIKEIGKTFVNTDTALDGTELDDNYKGLIILCLLYHETGIDPGAATVSGSGKGSLGDGSNYPNKNFTDTQVWGMQIVNTVEKSGPAYGGKGPTSMTKEKFQNSPVWNPAISKIAGMPIKQQLEYYQQYYARMFTTIMNINDSLSVQKQSKNSAYGSTPKNPRPYTGLDPEFVDRLVKKYENESVEDGEPYLTVIKGTKPGPRKEGNVRPYPLQNIYDLYGFHDVFSGTSATGYGFWLGGLKRVPFTFASRTVRMISLEEHVPRYAQAVNWDIKSEGIKWDKIIVGISPYLDEKGLKVKIIKNTLAFPFEKGPKGSKVAIAVNQRWLKGQRGGGVKPIAPDMPKVLKQVQESFLNREKNLEGKNIENVTFNPDYGT